MRILVLAVGKMKQGPERELISRYEQRFNSLARSLNFSNIKLVELTESRASSAAARKKDEAERILNVLPEKTTLITLDERGKSIPSEKLAQKISEFRDNGKENLAIVIGGADGLDPDLRARAQMVINFGEMTWPHQLVRILLFEQLYRTATILSNHPYHRS